jgi:glycosyltransferase involved in cell wall biosynthesis
MIVVQPYYYWKGHYRQYANSLRSKINIFLDKKNKFKPILVKNDTTILYILSRFLNYIYTIFIILKIFQKNKKLKENIHFLEFEPFAIIFFIIINFFLKKSFLITIHSTGNNNKFLYLIQIIRKFFYIFTLYSLNFTKCYNIIVHKKIDKIYIQKFYKKNISILDYPCPIPKVKKEKEYLNNFSLLLFGQIRSDKNIENFFRKSVIPKKINITIAGKIENISFWNNLKKKRKVNLTIYNKFISLTLLKKLIKKNDFNFLPYDKSYSGSAGPLKDSMSYGQPVICSNIPLFKNFLKENNVGFIYSKKNLKKILNIDLNHYNELSKNCINYCKKNNFKNFLEKHSLIYKKIDKC